MPVGASAAGTHTGASKRPFMPLSVRGFKRTLLPMSRQCDVSVAVEAFPGSRLQPRLDQPRGVWHVYRDGQLKRTWP